MTATVLRSWTTFAFGVDYYWTPQIRRVSLIVAFWQLDLEWIT